jgi:hypothetical protein
MAPPDSDAWRAKKFQSSRKIALPCGGKSASHM